MKKRIFIFTGIVAALGAAILSLNLKPDTKAQASEPDIYGKYGVTIDAATGKVLYGKNEHETSSPASLAKMMTVLLLLEKVKPDEEITITQNALNTESGSSKITLHAGEKLKRDEALKLMLTISVDQVAESVAEHISGSKEEFVKLMNKRAKQLGAKHTGFHNASGADAIGHNTSAYDLAVITKKAIQYPQVLANMNTVKTVVHTSQQEKEIANNGRKDLYDDPYAIGSKSGLTALSGYTLVTIDEKDGRRVINVVLKSDKEHLYKDAKTMGHYVLK